MQRKALQVQVELEIQAVTCPGVYLCPNGKVSLQLYMLDSCIQTGCASPAFPILFNEKLIFFKMFYETQRLNDLLKLLNKECLYIELIQWQNTDEGIVLSTFQTNLSELLYPSTFENSKAGIDIDLLMEPERSFPGVIAPKIEVSTKTIIEDVVLDSLNPSVVNPKVIQSKFYQNHKNSVHLKRVCHSTGYHRYKKCLPRNRNQKPPFIVRKVDDNLLGRKPSGLSPNFNNKCNCFSTKFQSNYNQFIDQREKLPKINEYKQKITPKKHCTCKPSRDGCCAVCVKYENYFQDDSDLEEYPTLNPSNIKQTCRKQKMPQRNCNCEEIATSQTSKVIRCTSPTAKDKERGSKCPFERCSCNTQTCNSLATKLHRRLNQTLECIEGSEVFSDPQSSYSPPGSDVEYNCPNPCYTDHYKDFYKKAKSRINYERYITPCCI
ncbi:uncharacterized protein [Onthophagus taurus]|uniref:uncharacterized protein n=1 Tax=Onthophagus taurus TaxID=166361 RepID=UPI000C201DD5|nr:uncharacterized protein LOC111421362 [Onthophagus taurus]